MNSITEICNKCKRCDSCNLYENIFYDYEDKKIYYSLCCFKKELQKSDLNAKQQKRLEYFFNASSLKKLGLKANIITEKKYFLDIIKKEIDNHDFRIIDTGKCPYYAEICMIMFNQAAKNE